MGFCITELLSVKIGEGQRHPVRKSLPSHPSKTSGGSPTVFFPTSVLSSPRLLRRQNDPWRQKPPPERYTREIFSIKLGEVIYRRSLITLRGHVHKVEGCVVDVVESTGPESSKTTNVPSMFG